MNHDINNAGTNTKKYDKRTPPLYKEEQLKERKAFFFK